MKRWFATVFLLCSTDTFSADIVAKNGPIGNVELGRAICKKLAGTTSANGVEKITITSRNGISWGDSKFLSASCGGAPASATRVKAAVDPSGNIFRLPDQFSAFVRIARISISTSEDALLLARNYLELSPGEERIISNVTDIIGYGEKPVFGSAALLTKGQEASIRSPNSSSTKGGFLVTAYSWNSNSGSVKKFDFAIKSDGQIHIEKVELATGIGRLSVPL